MQKASSIHNDPTDTLFRRRQRFYRSTYNVHIRQHRGRNTNVYIARSVKRFIEHILIPISRQFRDCEALPGSSLDSRKERYSECQCIPPLYCIHAVSFLFATSSRITVVYNLSGEDHVECTDVRLMLHLESAVSWITFSSIDGVVSISLNTGM